MNEHSFATYDDYDDDDEMLSEAWNGSNCWKLLI